LKTFIESILLPFLLRFSAVKTKTATLEGAAVGQFELGLNPVITGR
jgi:hypothetical protein